MGRIRTIKPEFPQSESMGRVSREARLCFIMLWTICDDEGRARGSSRMLASLLFPYDEDAPSKIDGWLDELQQESCIIRYSDDEGTSYLASLNWRKHQKIDRPGKSRVPSPPSPKPREVVTKAREHSTNNREGSSEDQGPRIKEGTKERIKGKEDAALQESAAPVGAQGFAPHPLSPKTDQEWLWSEGLNWLAEASQRAVRSLRGVLGGWRKELADNDAELRLAFEEAIRTNPAEPVAWLSAAVQTRAAQLAKKTAPKPPQGHRGTKEEPPYHQQLADEHRRLMGVFVDCGFWPPDAGPRPGLAGCRIAENIRDEFPNAFDGGFIPKRPLASFKPLAVAKIVQN